MAKKKKGQLINKEFDISMLKNISVPALKR